MSVRQSTLSVLSAALALGTIGLLPPAAIAQSLQEQEPEALDLPSESIPVAPIDTVVDVDTAERNVTNANTGAESPAASEATASVSGNDLQRDDIGAAVTPSVVTPNAGGSDSIEANAVDTDTGDADAIEPEAVEPDAVEPDAVETDTVETDTTTPEDAPPEPNHDGPDGTSQSGSDELDSIGAEPVERNADTPESDSIDDATDTDTEGTTTSAEPPDPARSETTDAEAADPEAEAEAEAARQQRLDLFAEGDRLFEAGQYSEAEAVYRQAKGTFEGDTVQRTETITDPALLPPAGQVYWREYQAGLESGLDTRIDVPLQLLTQEHPEFIPGHLSYAERLNQQEQEEEALAVLERAAALYPNDQALAQARIDGLVAQESWLQAAIAARQFALLNPEHPAAAELSNNADEYQSRFRRRMRSRITRNAIGNVLAGGVGFALTGNIFGPLSALQTSILLLRGESAVGERAARQATEELEIITDQDVVTYIDALGQELARLGGRSEFEYEFYVVAEDELNAFALPGGKVFINAGAILNTETTAELAGLVSHELAHAVLSHGFQMMTGGNLMANVLQVAPYGGIAANLAVLSYSRDMERQADRLGTRILAASPYAADGMARLMETLNEENPRGRFDWLSSHPDTPERIRRLNTIIEENGYNRYAYEGVADHQRVQDRVRRILIQAGVLLELDENGEPIEPDLEADPEPDLETEPNPELEAGTEPSLEPEASPESEVGPEPEVEPEPETAEPSIDASEQSVE